MSDRERQATLARHFLSCLGQAAFEPSSPEELGALLAKFLDEARVAWPTLLVPDLEIVTQLAERLTHRREPNGSLASLHGPDFYLACACTRGDAEAQRLFVQSYEQAVMAALRKAGIDDSALADLKQLVFVELLVGNERKPMALASYAGLGTLRAWVWVVAARAAYHHMRRPDSELACGLSVELTDVVGKDPEVALVKTRYAEATKGALREALQSLTPHERNLLRFRFLEGLTLTETGGLFALDHSTVSRQLRAVQIRLLETTRQLLRARLGAGEATVDSILVAMQSQLDSAIDQGLKPETDAPA